MNFQIQRLPPSLSKEDSIQEVMEESVSVGDERRSAQSSNRTQISPHDQKQNFQSYQNILPSLERESEQKGYRELEYKDSNTRKRKLIIEQEAEEEGKTGNDPMDVVILRDEEVAKENARAKDKADELKKAEERLTAIAKKAQVPKYSKKGGKLEKKTTKIARVSNEQSIGESQTYKKLSSNKSVTTQPTKKVIEKQAKMNQVAKQQHKRRKFKKQETQQVEIIQSKAPEVPVENGRPRRNRNARLEFWKSCFPVYSKKSLLLGLTNLSNEKFLEILGFHSIDTIKTGKAYFSSKDIKITISIGPKQKLYSAGINTRLLQECGLSHLEFDEIFIAEAKNTVTNKLLKAFVDDINEVDIEEGFKVRHGETFSIENTSAKKSQHISITFHKGEEDSE